MTKCKCDISKCKASCCYNVPHTMYTLNTNKKRIVTPYSRLNEMGEDTDGRKLYVPMVDEDITKNKCPFLRDDCRCNIYDKRPWICRNFGEPPKGNFSKFLHCGWLEGKNYNNVVENASDADAYMLETLRYALNHKITL